METWKAILGCEGFYEVSDAGRIRSLDRDVPSKAGSIQRRKGRIMKTRLRLGYQQIPLTTSYKMVLSVHTVVLIAFVGPRPKGMECRHLNGDPADNRLENLRWGTVHENIEDKRRHGTLPLGTSHWNSKMTPESAADVLSGRLPRKEYAALYGVALSTVDDIQKGRTWQHLR